MKAAIIRLSQQYVVALEKHLKKGPQANLLSASILGRQAVAQGLETLDLARIHEKALDTLGLSKVQNGFTKLAGIFFIEANTRIEETHRTARQSRACLDKLMSTLSRRTKQLIVSNRKLKPHVVQRKLMKHDCAERGKRHQKRLDESLELQRHLRRLTHQVLAAQEDERKQISRQLQNNIAQTLLGINVRLLSLKREARSRNQAHKNEIASTQQLVAESVKLVRETGRKIGRT